MRIAAVADVHSNLAAFEAVLAHAEGQGPIDRIWCLGDLVGYGPAPGACIALLCRYAHSAVAGNHDRAAVGLIGTDEFNPYAAAAAIWTATQLSGAEKAYLAALPDVLTEGDFTLVHGSLRDPVWEYLLSPSVAAAHLAFQRTPFGLVGHSHVQFVFYEDGQDAIGQAMADGVVVALGERRFVANPGGLGQPRDGDPRACYALIDDERRQLTYHRVPYDIPRTQATMRAAGLPDYLVDRLARGR